MGGEVHKVDLRKRLKRVLGNVSAEEWHLLSEAAALRLVEVTALAKPKTVMMYMPLEREVDISSAAEWCIGQGIRVAIPRPGWDDQSITPVIVDAWGENLSAGRHGIREPAESALPVNLADLDLVVVPGLAFDAAGARLGRGGGFYDRFLSRPGVRAWKVGVGLDEQVVESVPRDVWDVGLDALVTPTRTLVFAPAPGRQQG